MQPRRWFQPPTICCDGIGAPAGIRTPNQQIMRRFEGHQQGETKRDEAVFTESAAVKVSCTNAGARTRGMTEACLMAKDLLGAGPNSKHLHNRRYEWVEGRSRKP